MRVAVKLSSTRAKSGPSDVAIINREIGVLSIDNTEESVSNGSSFSAVTFNNLLKKLILSKLRLISY